MTDSPQWPGAIVATAEQLSDDDLISVNSGPLSVVTTLASLAEFLDENGGGWVTLKDFDAVGDGVTDDTAALQRAVDYVGTHTALLFCATGNYKITGEITLANCTTRFGIQGAGSRLTRFLLTSFGQTKAFFRGNNTTTRRLQNLLFDSFEVCAFQGDSSGSPVSQKTDPMVFFLPFESGSVFNNIRVRAIGNTAYWLSECFNTRMADCWAFGAGGWSVTEEAAASFEFYAITAGTTTLTAVTGAPFNVGQVGKVIYLGNCGTEGFPWATTVASYTSPTQIELTDAPTRTMTASSSSAPGGRISFDGVKSSITALSKTLVLNVDCMDAGDVGRLVYVVGAGHTSDDDIGSVLVTIITAVTSAHEVELADAAATTATLQDVYFTPAYFIGSLSRDSPLYTNDITITRPLVEAWKGVSYLIREATGVNITNMKAEGWSGNTRGFGWNGRQMILDAVRTLNIDGCFFAFGYSYLGANILICGGRSAVRFSGIQGSALPANQYFFEYTTASASSTLTIDGGSLNKPDAPAHEPGLIRYGGVATVLQVFQGAPLLTRLHANNTLYGQRFIARAVEAYSPSSTVPSGQFVNTDDLSIVRILRLEGDRATPTANDSARVEFYMSSDAGVQTGIGRISIFAASVTDGAMTGYIGLGTMDAGGAVTTRSLQTGTAFRPNTNDGIALGAASVAWSDLFLASGGVIGWGNNAYTLTQSGATLTASGSISATYLKTGTVTVATLPAAATAGAGARHFVTDATATLTAGIGTVVAGTGGNGVPVVSDGIDWRIG